MPWKCASSERHNGTSADNAVPRNATQSNDDEAANKGKQVDLQGLLDEKNKLLDEKTKEVAEFKACMKLSLSPL